MAASLLACGAGVQHPGERPVPTAVLTQECLQAAGCYKTDCIGSTDVKALDGGGPLETAVLSECSPARWTELRAAQLDWQSSHAQQDLYAQASAQAFASSRQALQAFARLSGAPTQASEAAALSLIRVPLGSSPPILQRISSSSAGECVPAEGLHAALSAPTNNLHPLSQLCHEFPISQIMQGSHHLHGSQELSADPAFGSSASLQSSTQLPQQERGRCCGPDRSQHGSERSSRADRSQHGVSRSASQAAELNERSSSGVREQAQQPLFSSLRDARDAERVRSLSHLSSAACQLLSQLLETTGYASVYANVFEVSLDRLDCPLQILFMTEVACEGMCVFMHTQYSGP